MPPDDALINRQLKNVRIDRLIGRGGMARVYYGWDVALDRPVAVKIIDGGGEDNLASARRLVSEARAIARWRHPHIVQVYHADAEEDLSYFVMEYVEGLDVGGLLHQVAGEGVLIPHEDVLRIGWAIARALDYAHSQGIIHRDVKPANVLVADDGRIVLTDFGLALDQAQGTLGEVFGTPHYIAPEQAVSSAHVLPQSDLYALGVMLYEMLTGVVPFDDPSPISLALKHVSDPPPLPSTINPDLSIAAEAVLLKALSKEPEARFPSGAALMTALENALKTPQTPPREQAETTRPSLAISTTSIHERVALYLAESSAAATRLRPDLSTPIARPTPPLTPARSQPKRRWLLPVVAGGGFVAVIGGLGLLILLLLMEGARPDPALPPAATGNPTQPSEAAIAGSPTPLPVSPESGTVSLLASPTATSLPAAPSSAPQETPNPPAAPTILYPDGYRMVLIYHERGLYLWNPGSKKIQLKEFVFEMLDEATGQPAFYRFEGSLWAEYSRELLKGRCVALEIVEFASTERPDECLGFNATRTPSSTSEWIFWLPREGISQFRVLWKDEEIARCETAAGSCEVFLPE